MNLCVLCVHPILPSLNLSLGNTLFCPYTTIKRGTTINEGSDLWSNYYSTCVNLHALRSIPTACLFASHPLDLSRKFRRLILLYIHCFPFVFFIFSSSFNLFLFYSSASFSCALFLVLLLRLLLMFLILQLLLVVWNQIYPVTVVSVTALCIVIHFTNRTSWLSG
jgi:hypothetical protein